MLRRLAAALALSCAALPAMAQERAPVASAVVVRDGDRWTADYALSEDAPAWLFAKSDLPRESRESWRAGTVTVLTPGVSLVRLGHYDALVAADGKAVPRQVKLAFTPFEKDIESGYDPALVFSDGSVALYTSQFKLVPARSRADAAAASNDSNALPGGDRPTHIVLRDRSGPVLFRGERSDAALIDDYDTYILFGRAEPVADNAITTLIDPQLPAWFATYLREQMPRVLGTYQRQLGPAPVGKPMLMVSWAGAAEPGISLSGSVLPGTVVMTIGGDKTLTPSEKLSHYARWFVAHEAAHFWLGQAVGYSSPEESWITEGGAELLAFRAVAAADPTFDIAARLGEAKSECLPLLVNGSIAAAEGRGDFRAHYACGVLIALVAEQAAGGDFPAFVRDLIASEGKDGTISRAEWLAAVERRLPGRGLPARIGELLDHGSKTPGPAIDALLAAAAVRQPVVVETKPAP